MNMNTRPKVSVLMPNLNSGSYVIDAIKSVESQTFKDFEVIICDSGSQDGSLEELKHFESRDSRVRLFNIPKNGVYSGWNDCIKRASGEYIYFATTDDLFSKNFLEVLVVLLDNNPSIDIGFTKLWTIDNKNHKDLSVWESLTAYLYTKNSFKHSHVRERYAEIERFFYFSHLIISANQMLIRRSLFTKTGLFDESFGNAADIKWQLDALQFTDIIYAKDADASWRRHDKQITKEDPNVWVRDKVKILVQFLEKNPSMNDEFIHKGIDLVKLKLYKNVKGVLKDLFLFKLSFRSIFLILEMVPFFKNKKFQKIAFAKHIFKGRNKGIKYI